MNASILDLRYKTREVLRAIDRNESVAIFYRGTKKAVMLPVQKSNKITLPKTIPGVGMWKDIKESVPDLMRRLRKGRSF